MTTNLPHRHKHVYSKLRTNCNIHNNKANLRDLIAATGLVILLKLDSNHRFCSPCDPEIWWMTPKNNPAPLLCYVKRFASFRSHWWIQTGITVRKRPIWVKFDNFYNRVTLKYDGWPCKTIGHLFYATWSFVQHFIAIGELKLELPLVTVRKCPIWIKINDFLSRVILKLDGWPWKTIGHLFYDTLSFVHHFNAISKFKLKLKSGNAQFGSKSTIFGAVWPRNFTGDPEKQ